MGLTFEENRIIKHSKNYIVGDKRLESIWGRTGNVVYPIEFFVEEGSSITFSNVVISPVNLELEETEEVRCSSLENKNINNFDNDLSITYQCDDLYGYGYFEVQVRVEKIESSEGEKRKVDFSVYPLSDDILELDFIQILSSVTVTFTKCYEPDDNFFFNGDVKIIGSLYVEEA